MPTIVATAISERAVRIREVMQRVGISRTQIYRLIQRGDFPAPVRLSDRISIWRQKDIDEWLSRQFEVSSRLRSTDNEVLLQEPMGDSSGQSRAR
jgi:prophage regulatory protein